MKINLSVDMTPAELREFLGFPDVQALQKELVERAWEQMRAGGDEFDPVSMMKPFITPNVESIEAMQRAFWSGLAATTGAAKRDRDD